MKDPGFIADMKKHDRLLVPKSGKEIQAIIDEVLSTPKALIERTQHYLGLDKAS